VREVLFQYNPWWETDSFLQSILPRDRYVDYLEARVRQGRVILLSGIRRVGKSTILKLLADRLIGAGADPRTILYVSLDDYVLHSHSILEVVDEFRSIHRHPRQTALTLLLDEVTAQDQFHLQLKTLIDREHVSIVASASSASLLRDSTGALTGRHETLEVAPLTFAEYLEFRGIAIARRDARLDEEYFHDYARAGGLPERVIRPGRDYLMSLVEDIIQRDITAYHGLRDHHVLRDFYTLLMERAGKQISMNKIARILQLSPDTARRYLGYFEDTYLIHLLHRYGKPNERLLSPRKVYACDLGMKHLFVGDRDWGSYFENYVYMRIRQYHGVFYVTEGAYEIDFYTENGTLIEATFGSEMSEGQRDLFERFDAGEKIVVRTLDDLADIEAHWSQPSGR
jgi:predicted AAA+ superfamily ATPase